MTDVLTREASPAGAAAPAGGAARLASLRESAKGLPGGPGKGPMIARFTTVAVVYLLFMNTVVGLSLSNILNGIALGALYGIIAVALVLV